MEHQRRTDCKLPTMRVAEVSPASFGHYRGKRICSWQLRYRSVGGASAVILVSTSQAQTPDTHTVSPGSSGETLTVNDIMARVVVNQSEGR